MRWGKRMTERKALELLKAYKIIGGVIKLKGYETKKEKEAINYLCAEWDYDADYVLYKDIKNLLRKKNIGSAQNEKKKNKNNEIFRLG